MPNGLAVICQFCRNEICFFPKIIISTNLEGMYKSEEKTRYLLVLLMTLCARVQPPLLHIQPKELTAQLKLRMYIIILCA